MESQAGVGNVVRNRELTEMAMGYSRSRILAAAARLGLADLLGDEPRSVDDLAVSSGAHADSLYRLLRGLASFGIVSETAPRYFVLTSRGKPLRKDAPNSEWAAIVFWADLLAESWSHMIECIRTGENSARIMERDGVKSLWSKDPDAHAIFGAVMGTAPAEDYMQIARAWDVSSFHTVADLGGGGGGLLAAVLTANPKLHGILVDLPEFIDKAASRLEKDGLAARSQTIGADLLQGVPSGAEVYMLKHVLHGRDDSTAVEMLAHCKSVLPDTGRVLVIEFVLPDVVDHADPALEMRLMSDLNMLAVTGGKERSAVEWRALLDKAGFECQRIIPVPGDLVSIIEAAARRP
jgi:hypothetical protein